MLFGKTMREFLRLGGVVVATSNYMPADLKPRGVGVDAFRPYGQYFFQRVVVHNMDSAVDYRHGAGLDWKYFLYPLNNTTQAHIQAIIRTITGGNALVPDSLRIRGHDCVIPRTYNTVAIMDYTEILEQPYGAEDFIALAEKYPTLVLENVPKISGDNTSIIKRFIILIDAYYEAKGKVIITADTAPENYTVVALLILNLKDVYPALKNLTADKYV